MRVISPPTEYVANDCVSVFMAGGITGWRDRIIDYLSKIDCVLLNPRLESWPTTPHEIEKQVAWERRYLREATVSLFWFDAETVSPMTLLELGSVLDTNRTVVVGAHPSYPLHTELSVRCTLSRTNLPIAGSLQELAQHAIAKLKPASLRENR